MIGRRRLAALIAPALAALLLAAACGDGEGRATGRFVFVHERDGNDDIYVMNADGSNQTRLTDNPAGDYLPDWSPAP